ncbi:hypothetical protein M441DRAFT_340730 [Trichoderma asperellum CBS 433.97]|uniref:Cation/H+ exchanger domain-containing protein n=1 Tax=Trichoderma asperellum (strain ATCC 204424 / CBS 433.97 / NBRC 101777) TaxID=1042311 RepID=A0A2T3ZGY3_TRIA4|nr:hypothetical protein M441DRAFT_340730 [Trichoderma asperellum CBS 433.97]PTB44061.1 hypothetical protein M441DRAFT_340730 [Trichoderma asperellum CBS 433.97]
MLYIEFLLCSDVRREVPHQPFLYIVIMVIRITAMGSLFSFLLSMIKFRSYKLT